MRPTPKGPTKKAGPQFTRKKTLVKAKLELLAQAARDLVEWERQQGMRASVFRGPCGLESGTILEAARAFVDAENINRRNHHWAKD